jgi:hypothetical protein
MEELGERGKAAIIMLKMSHATVMLLFATTHVPNLSHSYLKEVTLSYDYAASASGMSRVNKGYEQGNCSSVFAGSTRISLSILLVNCI